MQYYFAPMEGVTDDIYRSIHHSFYGGISKYFIPFISPTNQLTFSNRELKSVSRQLDAQFCCVPQILTKEAETFVMTADMLSDIGYAEVNLNLGCPSGTVTGKGKGSAMLRDPDALRCFFDVAFAHCQVSISVKTRIGFDDCEKWSELVSIFASYPFSEVVIHPRTRREFYKGPIHETAYSDFYGVKPELAVFNGDLFTPEDIANISARYPLTHAVMLGRGLVAAPFLHCEQAEAPKLKRFHDALLHAYIDDRPVNAVLGHMSEIMSYMCCCFEGSKKYLKLMQKSRTVAAYTEAADAMFESCPFSSNPFYSPF